LQKQGVLKAPLFTATEMERFTNNSTFALLSLLIDHRVFNWLYDALVQFKASVACGVDDFVAIGGGNAYAKHLRLGFSILAFELRQVWCLEQLARAGQNVTAARQGETVC
jgi:hypothetical protein